MNNLLDEHTILKALAVYNKPVMVDKIVKQLLHQNPALGKDDIFYRIAVFEALLGLAKLGKVKMEPITTSGAIEVYGFSLGPLERLAIDND